MPSMGSQLQILPMPYCNHILANRPSHIVIQCAVSRVVHRPLDAYIHSTDQTASITSHAHIPCPSQIANQRNMVRYRSLPQSFSFLGCAECHSGPCQRCCYADIDIASGVLILLVSLFYHRGVSLYGKKDSGHFWVG